MKTKLIKTEKHLLLLNAENDSMEINQNCYISHHYSSSFWIIPMVKVLAHKPLNNSPILEGVALLPDFKVEQFTLEDIDRAYVQGKNDGESTSGDKKKMREKFLYDIQQPKLPSDFICVLEQKDRFCNNCKGGFNVDETTNMLCPKCKSRDNAGVFGLFGLKTITNLQGKRVVQGEYKL